MRRGEPACSACAEGSYPCTYVSASGNNIVEGGVEGDLDLSAAEDWVIMLSTRGFVLIPDSDLWEPSLRARASSYAVLVLRPRHSRSLEWVRSR